MPELLLELEDELEESLLESLDELLSSDNWGPSFLEIGNFGVVRWLFEVVVVLIGVPLDPGT